VNAQRLHQWFTGLLAFITERSQDGRESPMDSLVRIVEHAERQEKWLARQARKTNGTRRGSVPIIPVSLS